jgi:hypothetical protein
MDDLDEDCDFEACAVNQIGEFDPDMVIWRYLKFEKFVSLIELGAVWFAKLGIFEDAEEGLTPELTRQ